MKLVKGTARPHRLNKAEPKPVVATPEPPDHLDDGPPTKFTDMAELRARHGVMTGLDTAALARYVVIWRRWLEAEAEVKRRGPVVKTSNDNIIQNPFLAVANKCLAQIAQIESEFGLTPSSRSRIRMAEPAETKDPFEPWQKSVNLAAGGNATVRSTPMRAVS